MRPRSTVSRSSDMTPAKKEVTTVRAVDENSQSVLTARRGREVRERTRVEVIPVPSLNRKLDALPTHSRVSVTCSSTHGVGATIEATALLRGRGHDAIPHLAARQFDSRAELGEVVARCDDLGVDEVFLIAGDAGRAGPYGHALELADAYVTASRAVRTIGFSAYPEGHSSISPECVAAALGDKQRFLSSAGVAGYVSTQMCFVADTVLDWARRERENGLQLAVRLGIPGPSDPLKLASMSTRIGVGNSIRYLRKNRSTIGSLLRPRSFDPTELASVVLAAGADVGVDGLHVFSFNNIGPTVSWLDDLLGG